MNNKSGFTLLEMLIIIIIVSVLAIIGKGSYDYSVEKSIVSEVAPMITAISFAQQAYYVEHQHFASDIKELNFDFTGQGHFEPISQEVFRTDLGEGKYQFRTKHFVYATWCTKENIRCSPEIAFTRLGGKWGNYYSARFRFRNAISEELDGKLHFGGVAYSSNPTSYDKILKNKVFIYIMKKILPEKDYESIIFHP